MSIAHSYFEFTLRWWFGQNICQDIRRINFHQLYFFLIDQVHDLIQFDTAAVAACKVFLRTTVCLLKCTAVNMPNRYRLLCYVHLVQDFSKSPNSGSTICERVTFGPG